MTNIIFTVVDTLRKDYWQKTKIFNDYNNTDYFFNADNVFATGSWTETAMPAMFSGTLYSENLYLNNFTEGLPIILPTLQSVLKKNNYFTSEFIFEEYTRVSSEFGYTRDFDYSTQKTPVSYSRKLDIFPDNKIKNILRNPYMFFYNMKYFYQQYKNLTSDLMKKYVDRDKNIFQNFMDWFHNFEEQQNFFAFLDPCCPHYPYAIPEETQTEDWDKLTRAAVVTQSNFLIKLLTNKNKILNIYKNSVGYANNLISSLIDFLKTKSKKPTILIITADHGDAFGENNLWTHPPHAHIPEVVNVPFSVFFFNCNKNDYKLQLDKIKNKNLFSVLNLPEFLLSFTENKYNLNYFKNDISYALTQGVYYSKFYQTVFYQENNELKKHSSVVPLYDKKNILDLYNSLTYPFPGIKEFLLERWVELSRIKTNLKLNKIKFK